MHPSVKISILSILFQIFVALDPLSRASAEEIHRPLQTREKVVEQNMLYSKPGGIFEQLDPGKSQLSKEIIPLPAREFRAAWVATVHNLDWPSRPGLSVVEMKREANAILDRLAELNMNAVIFQVRPHADAIYLSNLEPMSYYLTGKQGTALEGDFDPLAYWIKQAHSRGLQLHAWFNPYRVYHSPHSGPVSDQWIVKSRPELVVKLRKEGFWWVDPSLPEAREYTINVVMDVVDRYDIDGVHFDDYFYPYPAYNQNKDFPDAANYKKYRESGGDLEIKDWRRDAVNQLISQLHDQIKATKKHVEFGISPFGIWRPGYPSGISGLDQYNKLYADARLWIRNGWVDYLMPQLYWPIDAKKQSFPVLLDWWNEQNDQKRHLWPGLKIKDPEELIDQIGVIREGGYTNAGMCFFSIKGLMGDKRKTAQLLSSGPMAEKAVIPSSPWKVSAPPLPPEMNWTRDGFEDTVVTIAPKDGASFQLIINEKRNGAWMPPSILPGSIGMFRVDKKVEAISVRSVDRFRNISEPVVVEMYGANSSS